MRHGIWFSYAGPYIVFVTVRTVWTPARGQLRCSPTISYIKRVPLVRTTIQYRIASGYADSVSSISCTICWQYELRWPRQESRPSDVRAWPRALASCHHLAGSFSYNGHDKSRPFELHIECVFFYIQTNRLFISPQVNCHSQNMANELSKWLASKTNRNVSIGVRCHITDCISNNIIHRWIFVNFIRYSGRDWNRPRRISFVRSMVAAIKSPTPYQFNKCRVWPRQRSPIPRSHIQLKSTNCWRVCQKAISRQHHLITSMPKGYLDQALVS